MKHGSAISPRAVVSSSPPSHADVKESGALLTISEAADALKLEPHVLRFWELKFSGLKPVKRRGRRYYRPQDMQQLQRIRALLYDQGFTIKGAQKALRGGGISSTTADDANAATKAPHNTQPSTAPRAQSAQQLETKPQGTVLLKNQLLAQLDGLQKHLSAAKQRIDRLQLKQ